MKNWLRVNKASALAIAVRPNGMAQIIKIVLQHIFMLCCFKNKSLLPLAFKACSVMLVVGDNILPIQRIWSTGTTSIHFSVNNNLIIGSQIIAIHKNKGIERRAWYLMDLMYTVSNSWSFFIEDNAGKRTEETMVPKLVVGSEANWLALVNIPKLDGANTLPIKKEVLSSTIFVIQEAEKILIP